MSEKPSLIEEMGLASLDWMLCGLGRRSEMLLGGRLVYSGIQEFENALDHAARVETEVVLIEE